MIPKYEGVYYKDFENEIIIVCKTACFNPTLDELFYTWFRYGEGKFDIFWLSSNEVRNLKENWIYLGEF